MMPGTEVQVEILYSAVMFFIISFNNLYVISKGGLLCTGK